MGNLFSALNSAASAIEAFQQSIDVTQNNVANANSPGYAKQVPVLQSVDYPTANVFSGGVTEVTQDSRSQLADTAVRQQLSLLGQFQQLQTSLAPLQNVLDVSASSAIPSALNQLFQSFSQWSSQPGNAAFQTAVLNAAQQTAAAFQQVAGQLAQVRSGADQSVQSTVDRINQDAAKIQAYNVAVAKQPNPSPGQSAQLETTLEDLSGLADVQVLPGVGGTVTVLLGGQTPLVIGNQVDALQVQSDVANAVTSPPNVKIVDSNGADVTSQVSSGGLFALLNVRNNLIPSMAGGGTQTGDLNTLAKGLADTVNKLLVQGSTTATPPFQAGSPLFTYNAASASGIAASLQVNPAMTISQLAPTDPGPPTVSNGIALKLAGLDSDPAGQINGLSFSQFFGSMAAKVGSAASDASTNASAQTQLVTQTRQLQQQLSGVSIDEEAVRLIQLQSAFGAASKVVTIVDQLTQALMDMVH
jgi:flagellar hook-associated protein 1 FlgK